MRPAGWIFLIASLGFVWGLALWCFYKVVSGGKKPPDPVSDFHSA